MRRDVNMDSRNTNDGNPSIPLPNPGEGGAAYPGMMNDTMQILSGLTEDDYIAFPDLELCAEGAPTTKTEPAKTEEGMETMPESGVI